MKLTFSFGKTNSDAITLALGNVKNLITQSEKTYIVVPDRASLITELTVLDKLGISGALNFRVLTINKLANLVLGDEPNTLSSFGGSLLVKKILKQEKQNLVCFNKIASNMNFATELYRLIEQFKSSNITPNELEGKSGLPNGIKLKIDDIKRIWTEYEKIINENFSDGHSRLDLFKEKIKTSDEIKNANFVFLYSSSYTNQILNCVCEIIKTAKSTVIALPKPATDQKNTDIYLGDVETFFTQFAQKESVKIEKLFAQETNLMKEKLFSFTLGEGKQKSSKLHLFKNKNEIDEINACCNYIMSKVSEGASFSDFNLIMADAEHYEKPLKRAMDRNLIPHFFDKQLNISSHALARFVISVVNCFYFDFQSQYVLELVKNYYLGLTSNQLSDFENYVYKHGTEGGMFFSKFTDEKAEEVRAKLEFIFAYYKKAKAGKNAKNLIEIINNILAEANFETKTQELALKLELVNDLENAKITNQISQKLFEVLNDIVLIFGSQDVTFKEFREMLISGVDLKEISLVPIKTGSIYIGDVQNSFFASDKINYVLGASFGSFPLNIKDVGIISDDEIKLLKLKNKLEPSIKQLNQRAMFKSFEICCDANQLILSFAKEVDGENKSESLASVDLQNIFENVCETWQTNNNIISKADASLMKPVKLNPLVGKVDSSFNGGEIAITSVEKYFDCPFKFALLSGVKLKERESGIAKAFDIGNIYHEFMMQLMLQIDNVTQKNLNEKCQEIINKVLDDKKYETLLEVEQNKLIIKNIKKECVKLAKIALIHNNESAFKANKKLLEVSFGVNEKLNAPSFKNNGKTYLLKGKIDRVDTFENMARVIDYKTGSDKFNLADVFYGNKIQLISYLSCIRENGFSPVGAYYFPLKNDYKGKGFVPKLDGITLKDLEIVRKLDLNLDSGKKSNLINVGLKNDGSFSENIGKNTLLTAKEMENVQTYVKKLSACAIDEINSGFAEAWPVEKSGTVCSCDFCPFKNSFYCIEAKRRKRQTVNKQNFAEEEANCDD